MDSSILRQQPCVSRALSTYNMLSWPISDPWWAYSASEILNEQATDSIYWEGTFGRWPHHASMIIEEQALEAEAPGDR
ncbi:hypothetical protein L210DRAFT_3653591 [Boletus edulis BED1]|uniref:Uncharacterized protein n=1 Tax=Boletus edulis BED1 TaxID=1328754 RepID=A0AAD4BEM6_BOLED|nr:hypothetical protein L210DRAFT_3653591 [Boletus edulis BED1]